jgi:hypothetical protein
MKNCGIGLKGIYNFFMLHLEMVMSKELTQKNSKMVTNVTKNDGWEVFKGVDAN